MALIKQLFYPSLANVLIVGGLSFITFFWTFWVFHKPFLIAPVVVAIALRLLLSYLILSDYSASWSKASPRAFLIKTFISVGAFVIYVPIFHGQVRIALLISELFIYLFSVNFLMYAYQYLVNYSSHRGKKRLVIFGAGEAGNQVAAEFSKYKQYQLRAFVDDATDLNHRSINGVKICTRKMIKNRYRDNQIDLLIIALPSAPLKTIEGIYDFCLQIATEVKVLPSLNKILLDKPYAEQLHSIKIEDLLARRPTDLDQQFIKNFVKDKTVLITGAGGTIGGEVARQCLDFAAKQLILLDHSEFLLYQIEQDLLGNNVAQGRIKAVLLSVVNQVALKDLFKQYPIDIVIHSAAYKHVPMVEANIKQGIINNVIGTKHIIDVAIAYKVQKVVLISTDKAVRPTNVMGATKRICELYAQNVPCLQTQIVSVRFGNVLGSSGSAIPLFENQIKAGGPVTVTHPDITRYFMLIGEATQLVLQAAALGEGGEVFILDMGEPVNILSLAKRMIKLSGAKNIDIEFTGLRAGEKLYEELLINDSDKKTSYPSITVAQKDDYDIDALNRDIDNLLLADNPLTVLPIIVPEFKHQSHHD